LVDQIGLQVGKVKPYSPAEKAGLRPFDYIWTINGKEVFEMSHNECVNAIKNSGNTLNLATERLVILA
jgi:C-terminal processing protease CtpA/Prc